jgi:hypothetical protein
MFWKPVIVGLGGVLGAHAADIEGRAIGEVLAGAPSTLFTLLLHTPSVPSPGLQR